MKKEKKIPIEDVKARLQKLQNYRNINAAFGALFSCWIIHPRFKSPTRQTFNRRIRDDGFLWIKDEELASFESYLGYRLR